MDPTHECPVPPCRLRVPPQLLMCPAHWQMVPRELRSAVWRAWRGGIGWGTPEHVDATQAAISMASAAAGRSGG